MSDLRYSKKVMDRFLNPKNFGEIENADAIGKAGNPVCGDVMEIYLKIKDDKITDIKFKTLGCAAAIATSDAICDLVKGKTLKEAEDISKKEIVELLDNLPVPKIHCSVLATRALKDAIKNYRENK